LRLHACAALRSSRIRRPSLDIPHRGSLSHGHGHFRETLIMCGIAGIINLDPDQPVDVERLVRMRDVLRHRGPDGEGLWTDGPVGLAHRRLSIVDIAGGAQPMTTGDESAWIVFNGEIYNHPQLKPELEARGYRYR